MRILVTPLLLLFVIESLTAQPAEYLFGPGQFHHIAPSPDGNYFLLGSSSDSLGLRKIDPNATVIWEKTYPPALPETKEYGFRLAVLDSGDLLVVGAARTADGSNEIGLAMLANGDGQLIWKFQYPETNAFFDAAPAGNGFLLAGWYDNVGSATSGKLIRTDAGGAVEWTKTMGTEDMIYLKRIFPTADGNFLIAGRGNVIGVGFAGFFLQKISPEGDKIWNVLEDTGYREDLEVPPAYFPEHLGVVQMPDGSVWVAERNYNKDDIVLVHFSNDGQLLGRKYYGAEIITEYPFSLSILANGDFLITGRAKAHPSPQDEMGFAMRVSEKGLERWRNYYGKSDHSDRLFSSVELADGQFFLCGMSGAPPDAWLIRTDPDGNAFPWEVTGKVVADLNGNCEADPGEAPVPGWFLQAVHAGDTLWMLTDPAGTFRYKTGDGTTTFTLLPGSPSGAWAVCQNGLEVTSDASNPQAELTFVVQPDDPGCPLAEVGLTQPELVRCQTSRMYATIRNRGTGPSDSLLLSIALDDDLLLVSSTEPYSQTGEIIEFGIAPMDGFSQKTIGLEVQLACDPLLGAVHPVVAEIGPLACQPEWTGPRFEVTGHCEGSEVVFDLVNLGGGGSNAATTYRILSDDLLAADGVEVVLPEGEGPSQLTFPADGRTWRVELAQAPGFPGASRPAATVEGCGTGSNGLYSTGHFDAFRPDDAGPERSAVSPPNTTLLRDRISPAVRGLGHYNIIYHLDDLEFTARARNPLADTVQDVVFLLDFSPNLDWKTFELLAANALSEFSITPDGGIRVAMHGLDLYPGEPAQFRFRIRPFPDTPADAGLPSVFQAEGRAFFDEHGPFDLFFGFLNYSQILFPGATDEYNDYPSEIFLFGGRNSDFGTNGAVAPDGSVFLGGTTSSYSDRTRDNGLLIKADAEGKAFWLEAIDLDGGSSSVQGIVPLSDGGAMIAGSSGPFEPADSFSDIIPFVARVDSLGKMLWHKKFRPAGEEYGAQVSGMLQTQDGNCLVFGISENSVAKYYGPFYWKVDENGQTIWSVCEELGGDYYDPMSGMALPGDGFLFCGWGGDLLEGPFWGVDIQKISGQGDLIWNKHYEGLHHFYPGGIARTEDGGFLAGGYSSWFISPDDYGTTPTFVKFNADGEVEWEKNPVAGQFHQAYVYCLAPDPNGGFLAGGMILADTTGNFYNLDMLLMKLDANGEVTGVEHFGAKNTEWMETILTPGPGRILLWGYNQRCPPAYNLQAVLVVTDTITAVKELPVPAAGRTLVFPNPARDIANVVLSPPPATPVPWLLTDLNGRVLASGTTENGLFALPVEKLATGVYFLSFPGSGYPGKKVVVF